MGFQYVDRVYKFVRGTSGVEQAVLAYLAFRADDATGGRCHPSDRQISRELHFGPSAIGNARNRLRRIGLISWVKGGRNKGGGGRSLANAYTLHLPVDKVLTIPSSRPENINAADGSAPRQEWSAYPTWQGLHTPPDGECMPRQEGTIIPYHPDNQSDVVHRGDEVERKRLRTVIENVGRGFRVNLPQKNDPRIRREEPSVVGEAMRVCEVCDRENYIYFSKAMIGKNIEDCREVIYQFESELRQGEHANAVNRAAILTKRLGLL